MFFTIPKTLLTLFPRFGKTDYSPPQKKFHKIGGTHNLLNFWIQILSRTDYESARGALLDYVALFWLFYSDAKRDNFFELGLSK